MLTRSYGLLNGAHASCYKPAVLLFAGLFVVGAAAQADRHALKQSTSSAFAPMTPCATLCSLMKQADGNGRVHGVGSVANRELQTLAAQSPKLPQPLN